MEKCKLNHDEIAKIFKLKLVGPKRNSIYYHHMSKKHFIKLGPLFIAENIINYFFFKNTYNNYLSIKI